MYSEAQAYRRLRPPCFSATWETVKPLLGSLFIKFASSGILDKWYWDLRLNYARTPRDSSFGNAYLQHTKYLKVGIHLSGALRSAM